MRARFLLSGLVRCGRCGGRYQGVTRTSGKRKSDGTKYKHRYYGCGSYIAKGRTGCEFGSIPQEKLESAVIEAVLKFYRERYQGNGGMERLATAVREHLGHEAYDIAEAQHRLESGRENIDTSIAAMLDNISADTRDLIDERLAELRTERARLQARAEELERLTLKEAEVQDMVQELGAFTAGLESTLRQGVNDAKVAAIRRCVVAIRVPQEVSSPQADLLVLPHPSGVTLGSNESNTRASVRVPVFYTSNTGD